MHTAFEKDKDKDKEIARLRRLVLDLTDGKYKFAEDLRADTGHSLGKCAEMLKAIHDIQTESERGQL